MTKFKPLYVVQELSARCYAGCPGCFREFVKGPRDGDMSEEIFEAAVKDLPPGLMVLPTFHGESLLHPRFEYFMRRYRDLNLRVSIPTSGLVGTKYIPTLVGENTPVYVLIVSVDGFQAATHAFRRGRISLTRAEGFLETCLSERGERKTPMIAVRWVEGGQSEIEFESYLRRWLFEKKVDFVLRSRMFNYGSPLCSRPIGRCRSLIEGNPVVLFNGDVLLCERVVDREKYVLGNVLNETLPNLMKHREEMVGDYPNAEPCKSCSAAYLLAGLRGMLWLRHHLNVEDAQTIYVHSDHSQTYYSLVRNWSGINWSLKTEREALEALVPLEATR
jgi:radical SAM protein with 4Fe4S-binding SPASM domain